MKPRLFFCFLIVFVKFVAPNRSVDCSDEVVNDFYGLSVMTVNFRFLVDDNFVDKRMQNFGREFFISAELMNNVSLIFKYRSSEIFPSTFSETVASRSERV